MEKEEETTRQKSEKIGFDLVERGKQLHEKKDYAGALDACDRALAIAKVGKYQKLLIAALRMRSDCLFDKGLTQQAIEVAKWADRECGIQHRAVRGAYVKEMKVMIKKGKYNDALTFLVGSIRADEGPSLKWKFGTEWMPETLSLLIEVVYKVDFKEAQKMLLYIGIPRNEGIWSRVLTILSKEGKWLEMCVVVLGAQILDLPESDFDQIAGDIGASAAGVDLSSLFDPSVVSLRDLKAWGTLLAKTLMLMGAPYKTISKDPDWPPLFLAAQQCIRMEDKELVRFLLEYYPIDLQERNRQWDTVMHTLVGFSPNHDAIILAELVGLLVMSGADLTALDRRGYRGLDLCKPKSHLQQYANNIFSARGVELLPKLRLLKEEGNKEFRQRNCQEAVKHYKYALDVGHKGCLDPEVRREMAILNANLSTTYKSLQQYSRAVGHARACLNFDRTYSKGYFRLGQALVQMNKLEEAFDVYHQGAQICPLDNDDGAQLIREMVTIIMTDTTGRIKKEQLEKAKAVMVVHWIRCLEMMTKEKQWEYVAIMMLGPDLHSNPLPSLKALWIDPAEQVGQWYGQVADLTTVLAALDLVGWEDWLPPVLLKLLQTSANWQELGKKDGMKPLHALVKICAASKTTELLEHVLRVEGNLGTRSEDLTSDRSSVFHTALEAAGADIDHPRILNLLCLMKRGGFKTTHKDLLGRLPQDMVSPSSIAFKVLSQAGVTDWENLPVTAGDQNWKKSRAVAADSVDSVPLDLASKSSKSKGKDSARTLQRRKEEEAERLREVGNKEYSLRNYQQAIQLYTQAIQVLGQNQGTRVEETHHLSILHANRCECYLRLGQPKQALEDAMASVHLDGTWYKAHLRVGRAQMALKKYPMAVQAFSNCYNKLPLGRGPDHERLQIDVLSDLVMAYSHHLAGYGLTGYGLTKNPTEPLAALKSLSVPPYMWLRVSYNLLKKKEVVSAGTAFFCHDRRPFALKDRFIVDLKEFCIPEMLKLNHWIQQLVLHCIDSGSDVHTLSFCSDDKYLHAAVKLALYVYTTEHNQLLYWLFVHRVHPNHEENILDANGNTALHTLALTPGIQEFKIYLMQFLITEGVDPTRQNRTGQVFSDLIPINEIKFYRVAEEELEAFRQQTNIVWINTLREQLTMVNDLVPKKGPVHARQKKRQEQRNQPKTSAPVLEEKKPEPKKPNKPAAAKKEAGGASGPASRCGACMECWRVLGECQELMEKDSYKALNKLSGVLTRNHRSTHHDQVVQQGLELVTAEISRTLTPVVPKTILSLPEALYEQILQRLASDQQWRQLDAAVRQFYTERGDHMLKNFARNISLLSVLESSSLCCAEQLRLDILDLLMHSGAELTQEDAVAGIPAALKNREYRVLEKLVVSGADPSAISLSVGDTPLHVALTIALEHDKGNFSLFDKLVELGQVFPEEHPYLAITATDDEGNTLLHLACAAKMTKHSVKAVEKLLSLQVPVNYINNAGKTALQLLPPKDRREQFLRVSMHTAPQAPARTGGGGGASKKEGGKGATALAERKQEKEEKRSSSQEKDAQSFASSLLSAKPGAMAVMVRRKIEDLIAARPYPNSPMLTFGSKKKTQAERRLKDRASLEEPPSMAQAEGGDMAGSDAKPNPAPEKKKSTRREEQTEEERAAADAAKAAQEDDRETVDSEEEEEEEETAEAEEEEEEIDLTAFDNLEWEVECTAEVWKSLGDKKVPYAHKQRVVRCIQQLARGEWRKHMMVPVMSAPSNLQLFKCRAGHSIWVLWELAIAFSPRLSQAAEQRMLAELSGGEASAAARGGRMYTELIRAWDVVIDHAHVGRSIDRILKSHSRGQTCLIQRKLYGLKDSQPCIVGTKRLPRIFSETEVGVEQQSQLTLYPPASANQTEFHILKFYSFNAALVSNILRNIQTKVDFPFRVTDREHAIIHLHSNAPLLLLGRSGTGKTTCCLYRLWALFQAYWSKAKHSGPMLPRTQRFLSAREVAEAEEVQEEEEEAAGTLEVEDLEKTTAHASPPPSHHHRQHQKQKQQQNKQQQEEERREQEEEEVGAAAILERLDREEEEEKKEEAEGEEVHYDHLHQVFVTKNVVLCTEVHKNFSELCQASEAAEQHAARLREREALPTRLQDADDFSFPLFVTSRQLLLMLDASLPGDPFFQRNPDGTLKHRITGWGTQAEIFTPIGIDHDSDNEGDDDNDDDDSDDNAGLENVEEMRAAEAAAKKRGERQKREVTYNVFVSEVWNRFSKKERSHYHPSLVWMEIMSFIKGSFEALGTRTGYLSREGYQELGRKRAPNFSGERDRVYDLFERYRDMCHQMALFDEADLVFHIYQRLRLLDTQPWAVHQVFVDETQDFTQAELCVLLRLSQNPNDMFLTGDTAQSIMRGISFRFADLQSLFFYARRSMQALGKTAAIGVPKKVYQLTHNYRSHAGILSLASSVLDLLHNFFPESFDQLQPDQGLFPGPLPVLLQSGSPGDLALLLRGNQRKTSHIEFGAHQAILVVSEEAREKLPEELSMGLVLTIYEAKGLEFDDILLYNFFTDSEAGKEWRVVTKFLEDLREGNTEKQEDLVELDESVLDQSGRPRALNFDPYQHKVLNSELKHLYTAITRARVNVWIFDQDEEKRAPMFEYFRARRLVRDVAVAEEETRLEETMFAEKSSASEWIKRGDEIMRRGLYDVAAKCYRLGGDLRKESIALCYKKALQASRCRDNPRQMREEFLVAGLQFLEVDLDKKAAICLVNAKEPRLAALVFEKCGMMEQAARHYVRMRCMEDASRCFEYIGWYDQAVEVLQRDELYEKAIDCLRRYEQVKKDLEKTRGQVPAELLEHAPRPEYNIERLSYNLATRHHRGGNTAKMLEALDRLPSVADRINFLRDKRYIKEAANLMAKNGQGTEAARLMLGEGYVEEALELARTAGGDKQVRADCHLALVRSMFRNGMELESMKLHLHQALLLCQELGNDAGKAEAQLLQSRVEIDARLAMTAATNFQRCRPAPNVAGELEALDIFIHSSSATDSLDDAEMVVQGINKTFELIKLLLGNRSSAERLSYYLYLGFFGLSEVKDSEGASLLALRRAENPLFLELVPRKYWIFQKSDWKKPIIHLKVQDACLALSERLLTRIAREWMGFLTACVSHHYQGLLQCMFYRRGSECPMLDEDTCPLLHRPFTSEECRKVFRLCLMQVRLRHILDNGVVVVKRLQLPPARCSTLLKLIEECQKEKLGEETPGVPECFWPCHSLLLLLMPDDHLHRQLFEGTVKQRVQQFQSLQSTLIRVPMERYLQHLWDTTDEASAKKDSLLKYRVKRTDWLVKLCLIGPLFRMKLNAHKLSEQLVMDIMNTNPAWLKRGNRYALLMGGKQGATQTLATRFIEAYEHLVSGDPLESLIRFTKFVRILSDRDRSSLFPDHNVMLLLLEFFTALGLLLVAKTSPQAKVTVPASYLNAVTLVELTTAQDGKPGLCLQKAIEDSAKRKTISASFVRQRMEMIVGVLCGYKTRFSLIKCLFLLDESEHEASMLKERAIVLVLTFLSNVKQLVEPYCEIPLLQAIHSIFLGPSSPARLAGTLAKVRDANGIFDVAEALMELLRDRDEEYLYQLQWAKWDPRRASMVTLSKKLDGNIYPGHFMLFNKKVHAALEALSQPVEPVDTTAEEQLTEEEARKLEENFRAWEQERRKEKAGRTILRALRHRILLKRARRARHFVAKRLQMEVFVPFTVSDTYCGLCGVQLLKAAEGAVLVEEEAEEGQEEGREQAEEKAEQQEEGEARVTKAQHLRSLEHIVKNAEFEVFRRDYEQTIGPKLTSMGTFIIQYRLRDEGTRDSLYKEMSMDITGVVSLYDKVTQQVQEIMLSRGWNLRHDVLKSLHELSSRMSPTLQQFIRHKHEQVQREERRQQQDQGEGEEEEELDNIQEELEEGAAEEEQFEDPIPQARGGGRRKGGLRRQRRKNRR